LNINLKELIEKYPKYFENLNNIIEKQFNYKLVDCIFRPIFKSIFARRLYDTDYMYQSWTYIYGIKDDNTIEDIEKVLPEYIEKYNTIIVEYIEERYDFNGNCDRERKIIIYTPVLDVEYFKEKLNLD
jgi:hypothetical protein